MDAHFDPNQFHPTFLGNDTAGTTDSWHNHISMDSFLSQVHEYGLPDDVVSSAVTNAYDFFGMEPAQMIAGDATFVQPGNPYTYADDKLSINRDELMAHGVHDKDTLSLVCTHEIAHQLTQLMFASGQISPWQSELISDKWMGFRAAAEGLDLQKMLDTFSGLPDTPDHPGEDLRCEHARQAYETMREFMDRGVPADFNTLMNTATSQIQSDPDVLAREAQANQLAAGAQPQVQMGAYTKSEIDSHISEAQNKIDFAKNLIERKEAEAADRIKAGLPAYEAKATAGRAQIDLENAKKDLENWKNTEPSKS